MFINLIKNGRMHSENKSCW